MLIVVPGKKLYVEKLYIYSFKSLRNGLLFLLYLIKFFLGSEGKVFCLHLFFFPPSLIPSLHLPSFLPFSFIYSLVNSVILQA